MGLAFGYSTKMAGPQDATAIVNRAIQLIGDNQAPVTGTEPNFDSSAAGVAAKYLYPGVVQTVAKRFGWDFARNVAALSISGTAPANWTYQYLYPANGIEVRQLMPTTITDPNNPLPVSWTIANATISSIPTKVIWTNLPNAVAVFTNNPPVSLWDAGFVEAVVRLLASEMAMAILGKPGTSQAQLDAFTGFEKEGMARNG